MFWILLSFCEHESKTFCREFDFSTKDTHAPRPQQESSINCTLSLQKIISNCCCRVTHVHSSTHLHSYTLMYCEYTHIRLRVRTGPDSDADESWPGPGGTNPIRKLFQNVNLIPKEKKRIGVV